MDGPVARALPHVRNRAGVQVSEEHASVAGKPPSKYRTAILLGVFALGLFLFTLYSGLK